MPLTPYRRVVVITDIIMNKWLTLEDISKQSLPNFFLDKCFLYDGNE